ncbi:hypothetical protein ACIHFD_58725 [Nonomuraea sp. NPDC051941]|uniref:hypothetical protein n=1 Tax=Nonomuraea sp. NPDC051941 TaxID=3364373 RepID=UPI0037C7C0DD
MSRLRACWAVQAPVGFAVMPRTCARRVAISMTSSTYRRFKEIVSVGSPFAWTRKNVRQEVWTLRGVGQARWRHQSMSPPARFSTIPSGSVRSNWSRGS